MAREYSIALVGCGKRKGPAVAPARELYTGGLFRASLAYASSQAERVFVVSALHGLLHPDTLIAPYDRTLSDMLPPAQQTWARQIVSALGSPDGERPVLLLAGGLYERLLERYLYLAGWMIARPLRGMQIGERLHRLKTLRLAAAA